MKRTRTHRSPLLCGLVALGVWLCSAPSTAGAQDQVYSESLLPRLRAAAETIPGRRPIAIRHYPFAELTGTMASAVAGASTETATLVYTVFEIHFGDRSIIVDAGSDRDGFLRHLGANAPLSYRQDRFDSIQSLLRNAVQVVLTHEHFDHALGVQQGDYFDEIASKTLVSSEQLRSLTDFHPPGTEAMAFDSAAKYETVSYNTVHPIAPGVVLLRAPGHSPGSQFVYVQLASDDEFLLVGDLVWLMVGLQSGRQKPEGISNSIQEDREAIARQMVWVRRVMERNEIIVVPAHDKAWLGSLVEQGALAAGFTTR